MPECIPSNPLSALSRLTADRCVLTPSRQSERTKSLVFCRGIAHIKVREGVKRDGTISYVVQIFHKTSTSNIPTREHLAWHGSDTTSPDASTHQRFSAFATLSRELSYHANADHHSQRCVFCETTVYSLKNDRPRLRTKLFRPEIATQRELEQFLNATLELVQSQLSTSIEGSCDGQHEAPILLARFLTERFDPASTYNRHHSDPKERNAL